MNERIKTPQFHPAPSNFDRGDRLRRQERLLHYQTLVTGGEMSAVRAIRIARRGDALVSTAKHLKTLGLTRLEAISMLWEMLDLLLTHSPVAFSGSQELH